MTKTPWQIFDKEASGKGNNNPVNSIKINFTISEGFLVMFGVRFFGDPILPIEWKLATWIFLPSRFVLMYSCTKTKWLEKNTLSLWWKTPKKESYSPGQDSWSFTPGNLNKLVYFGGLKILAVQEFFDFFLVFSCRKVLHSLLGEYLKATIHWEMGPEVVLLLVPSGCGVRSCNPQLQHFTPPFTWFYEKINLKKTCQST